MLSVGILVANNPVYNWEAVFCGLEGHTCLGEAARQCNRYIQLLEDR